MMIFLLSKATWMRIARRPRILIGTTYTHQRQKNFMSASKITNRKIRSESGADHVLFLDLCGKL